MGQEIHFECTHGTVSGYMALPEGSGPALILLQEWWGIDQHMKDVVDRFSNEGFVCLAPDLYHGEVSSSPESAERHMMQLNVETTAKDVLCAVDYIKQHKLVAPSKVGVLGFCMGGQLALYAASLSDEVDACVDFYGIHPNVQPDFSKISCPVLGLFGGLDTFVPPEAVRRLEGALHEHGISHSFVTYEHAGHAFYNDTRKEVYQKEAAHDAHTKAVQFLRQHLC